ncbi:TonB-dependent receptor [Rheinheimera muenzenbergensis]|uniref:TonB-dependent receptor n=1 Tax=Rheinheimera muenzenbergensis TaxID=1193628 RepID=A0ABU8C3S6_9GAMM
MSEQKYTLSIVTLATVAGLYSNLATAQLNTSAEAASQSNLAPDAGVERIMVTAQRREESLQEVPLAITAISGDFLRSADAIRTANDVVQFVPNASASATDGRTRPRWFLRGVGTNDVGANTVSPIGIYNDDVYLNNVYIQGFPLFDLQQVEVLRGPQGSLWGKNTTGGALHFISRKPTFYSDGYARLTAGSFNERAIQGGFGGAINDDYLAGRISFYNEQRDGWVKNLYSGRDVGATKDTAARVQLLFTPHSDWELLFNYHTRTLDGDKNPSNYFADPSRNPPYNFGFEDPAGIDVINQVGDPAERGDADGGSVKLSWQNYGYSFTSVSAFENGNRILTGGSAIPVDNARSYAWADSSQFSQEFRLTSPREQRINWILGAFYFAESLTSDISSGTVADLPAGTPGRRGTFYERKYFEQDTSGYALFASLTANLTDNLRLTSGLRYSFEEKDFDYSYTSGGPRGTVNFINPLEWWLPHAVGSPLSIDTDYNKDDWDELTYDITPEYRFSDSINSYFRYARGFRAGGFAVNDKNTVDAIDPEVIDSYEFGVKSSWLDNKLVVNGAVFYYDYSDIQVLVLQVRPGDPNAQAVLQNAGTGYVRGAELEIQASPSDNLRLNASFGLLKTEYTDFPTVRAGQLTNAKGNDFARAPRRSATISAEYDWALTNGGAITLAGDLSYRSRQYFNAVTQNNPLLEQAGYALSNARISYITPSENVEITASVRNLADKEYTMLATGPSNNAVRRVFAQPRTFALSLTVHY